MAITALILTAATLIPVTTTLILATAALIPACLQRMGEVWEISGDDSRAKYDLPEPLATILTSATPSDAYGTTLDLWEG